MRAEKRYLVDEVIARLDASSFVFLMNFTGVTVEAAAELRTALRPLGAEFHVVKNSILNIAAKERELPDFSEVLEGPTAIVSGGDAVTEVAKAIMAFLKTRDRADVKIAVLDKDILKKGEIEALSKLPGLPGMRAQLLSLFLIASAQGILNVLKAKSEKEEGASA
jgi:large subunit ribosomal protein L10